MRRNISISLCVGALVLQGCTPTSGPHWRVVKSLTGNWALHFVEIDPIAFTKREVYDDAAKALCSEPGLCRIAFVAPGDRIPSATSIQDFFSRDGGFGGF